MAYTTINKPSQYFNTVLYTGNDSTQNITGVGFQPDLWWNKSRSGTHSAGVHCLYDVVRGTTKRLKSNSTDAEATISGVTAFNADGVTLGSENQSNGGSTEYVAWNWLANGAGVSNTSGSITSTVSANTTAGFSIVSYTATSGTSSIGHGLGVAPSMIILKTRDQAAGWITGLAVNGWDKYLTLNSTSANTTDDRMFSPSAGTDPTSTLFWSDQAAIGSAGTMIAYCFAEIRGYSKFGSYTGNGDANGTFVFTGFKPALVLQKTTSTTSDWNIVDNKRSTYNVNNLRLNPNTSSAESTSPNYCDLLSNGFKFRASSSGINGSGETNIYAAFAENPFVSSTFVPTTAR